MKIIALIAVIGVLLLQVSGAVPDSSVGGPMMLALAFFGAALAVGIHEAWSHGRGVLGWIASILVALVGASLAAVAFSLAFESAMPFLELEGSLAATRHPLLYVATAGLMLLVLMGSWLALQIVNRWR